MRADKLFDLAGETAIITGGGTGIGRQLALALAANGANIVVAGRDSERLSGVASEIAATGGKAIAVPMDIRRDNEIVACFDQAESALGPVSVLVNNAGIAHRDKSHRMDRKDFVNVMAVNVDGAFRMAQEAANRMIRDARGGSIINISSVLAHVPMRQVVAYGASKAAISQMTRTLALEWSKYGIRVNEIRPGWFGTFLTDPFLKGPGSEIMANQNPLGRLGMDHDLDGAVLLLASDAGRYMTGSAITVDGGHSLAR